MGNNFDKPSDNTFEIIHPEIIQFYMTDKQSVNGYIYLFFKPTKNKTIDNYMYNLTTKLCINNNNKVFEICLKDLKRIVTEDGPVLETTSYSNCMRITLRFNNNHRILEAVFEIPTNQYTKYYNN